MSRPLKQCYMVLNIDIKGQKSFVLQAKKSFYIPVWNSIIESRCMFTSIGDLWVWAGHCNEMWVVQVTPTLSSKESAIHRLILNYCTLQDQINAPELRAVVMNDLEFDSERDESGTKQGIYLPCDSAEYNGIQFLTLER